MINPYKEEEFRYVQLKSGQFFEERAQQIRKEEEVEIHSLTARGLHQSGMANKARRHGLIRIQRAQMQAIVESYFSLWKVKRIVPDKKHFEFLKEELNKAVNVEMVLEEMGSELVRLGNRPDLIEKQRESFKYDLRVCTDEILRDAEIKFYELRGTTDRKPKIFISADQLELEGVRSAVKNKIELEYPKQFDIFVFEGEVPDGDSPEEFYSKNLISSDIYIGIFKCDYSEATIKKEYELAKRHEKVIWLFFNVRTGINEDERLKAFKERIRSTHSYCEWVNVKGLEESIVGKLRSFQDEKPTPLKVTKKLVDDRWGDDSPVANEWRKQGYCLAWVKEEKVERKRGEGLEFVTCLSDQGDEEFRYVRKNGEFLMARKEKTKGSVSS